jgi:thymidylate synthase ThyX
MIDSILNDPAMPIYWGETKKGMSAGEELPREVVSQLRDIWLAARDSAAAFAEKASELGLHKQHANRLLEPFAHVSTILSATDFMNFFDLRISEHAQPEIRAVAESMASALHASTPIKKDPFIWHIPYDNESNITWNDRDALLAAAAACARVSYTRFGDGERNIEKDVMLGLRLWQDRHMSPFEHVAMSMASREHVANFRGWIQLRSFLDASSSQH